MLKVVIADDKPLALKGLERAIPWENLNARIVGKASDGREALAMVLESKADVLISDIKMPVMDGLELCKRVHQEAPNTVKIILSSYDYFEYAQKAIEYNVKHYFLKPINQDQLRRITNIIQDVSYQHQLIQQSFSQLSRDDLKEEIFHALKTGNNTWLKNFFDSDLPDKTKMQRDLTLQWCFKLHQLLSEFDNDVLFSNGLLGKRRQEDPYKMESIALKSPQEMISMMKVLYINTVELVNQKKISPKMNVVEFIKGRIQEEFCDCQLTITKLAEQLAVSPNYLSNIFNSETGVSINQYITTLRIDKAKELLSNPALSVQEISNMIGYYDGRYFARVFKKREGFTPSEYRSLVLGFERKGTDV